MYDTNDNMLELSVLLQEVATKYTRKESSSISIEKAHQLMNSILYNINIYLDENKNDFSVATDKTSAQILYNKGTSLVKQKVKKAKDIFAEIKQKKYDIDNLSYRDTIKVGIDEFFINYDINFASHETPGMIDYQLFIPVENLTGIKFILSYVEKLNIENEFCRNYNLEKVNKLLMSYSKDYSDLLINVFELVLTNSIGKILLKKDFTDLDITESDKNKLYIILKDLSVFQIEKLCQASLEVILKQFNITNKEYVDYLSKSVSIISQYIKNKIDINFGSLFITFDYSNNVDSYEYIDNNTMTNVQLRKFINLLNGCSNIDEKLSLINEKVHSLQDLVEILDNCIWEDEYEQVYNILGDNELNYLMTGINSLLLGGLDITDLKDWQVQLIIYLSN